MLDITKRIKSKYKYECSTMEVLMWESELESKPAEHLITIKPEEGDLAFIQETGQEYEFKEGQWVEIIPPAAEEVELE
jgi:hypothetical protein